MATIEPRLMHLLNGAKTPEFNPLKLAPLASLAPTSGGGGSPPARDRVSVSLPPIEQAGDQLAHQIPPFKTLAQEVARQNTLSDGHAFGKDTVPTRATAVTSGLPIHTLLGREPDTSALSSSSLSMLLSDTSELLDDPATKKRHRAPTVKDDFPQLPQPLKKQKSTQQVVPPIINGLQDPPPDALLFPPIMLDDEDEDASRVLKDFISQDDRDPRAGSTNVDGLSNTSTDRDKEKDKDKKRRLTKPRRKWSEAETNHLLLGVSKHGVGKWTTILEDTEFKFNDRSAGDLKDRFRTCCPDELRKSGRKNKPKDAVEEDDSGEPLPPVSPPKNVRQPEPEPASVSAEPHVPKSSVKHVPPKDADAPRQRRSRAHRKKIEDLEELGITGPFKKSDRRQRRAFSEQDDKEILEGLELYGPQWTKIQRDPSYHLSTRQPTDLRDRVRNKYPEIYARIEKGNLQLKNPDMHKTSTLEPSVNTNIDVSLGVGKGSSRDTQLNRTQSGEELRAWPINALLLHDEPAGFHPNANIVPGVGGGSVDQMDISRLLLDDSASVTDLSSFRMPLPGSIPPSGSQSSGKDQMFSSFRTEDIMGEMHHFDDNAIFPALPYHKMTNDGSEKPGSRRTTLPTSRPGQASEKR